MRSQGYFCLSTIFYKGQLMEEVNRSDEVSNKEQKISLVSNEKE
jgi:hypothetical protein